jgi:general secretion pathway protein D
MKRNSILLPIVLGVAAWLDGGTIPASAAVPETKPAEPAAVAKPVPPTPDVKPVEPAAIEAPVAPAAPVPAPAPAPAPAQPGLAQPAPGLEPTPPPTPDQAQTKPEPPKPPAGNPPPPAPFNPAPIPNDGLVRLNFRNVPLEMVLKYLSEAAGFIIIQDAEVKGNVDVWSNTPLTKEEAVDLLNQILNQNGYAAIRNERMLTIVKLDDARQHNLPVKKGNDADLIPKNEEMVTQIIPVRYANALALTQNLQPLLPPYAHMSANESGNSLVLTDTQSSIRRMVEIVQALDTSISSISTIRVFPLKYADAKELAAAVKELFQPPQTSANDRRNRFSSRFGRGGPPGFGGDQGGGDPNGGGAPVGTGDNVARQAASRVITVADDRTNALIVGAPDEFIPTIEQLVKEVDVRVDDITELRVFHLKNADPSEMASLFAELFPDDTQNQQNNRGPGGFRFFGRGGQPGGNQNNEQESDRMKKLGRVQAVADLRTSSLIVSAASELMPQIEAMITKLDSNTSKKQRVFVYSLENADVVQVEQILRDMFERNTTQQNRNRSTSNQNSPLNTRSQNQNSSTGLGAGNTGFRNSGFGNSGGLGTRTGQQFP